ncbi:MAG TPA: hypothetical protein VF699_08265 [Caulobacteraceae bacterium]|jgi:hypothetical protein
MKLPFGRSGLAAGLLAALVGLSAGALPQDAAAQGRDKRAAAAPKIDRAKGAAEAPAILQASGVTCSITDAAFIGTAKNASGKGETLSYEVACREGLGYLLQQATGAKPQAFDCIVVAENYRLAQAKKQQGIQCQLPANANPAQSLQPVIVQAGGTCTVSNARYMGTLPSNGDTLYEIACTEGPGFILRRPGAATAKPTLISCLTASSTPNACTLTTQAQVIAALAPVVAQAQRQCTVAQARSAGRTPTTNNEILEIGCAAGQPGFLMEVNGTGGFVRALDCDRVTGLTCQFTNTTALTAARRDQLLARVRGAGLGDCTPADARQIGTEIASGRDIIEVSCSNRPYGALALLSSSKTPRNDVYDCLFGPRWQADCTLSQPSAAYPRVSSALQLRGKNPNCSINNARWMGLTPQGENWFEIACQDGRSFLIDYRGNGQVARMLTCREGQSVGGGCRAGIGASVPKD